MKRIPAIVAALVAFATLPHAAQAELPVGAKAPQFATQGALAGKVFAFNLAAALRKGPVVLYFYPKSFTQGCTLEARAFAESMPKFRAAGATVIGLSADSLETQQKFSVSECNGQFPIGIATPAITKAYDVPLKVAGVVPTGVTRRTSYVIAPDGTIRLAYSNMDYRDHVKQALAAVAALQTRR